MYQRYYKQRKFGRFFGFFTVIGSGIYHFIKTNIIFVQSKFSTKNLLTYSEYMPNNVKSIIEFLDENETTNIKNLFSRSEFSVERERNFQIYKDNLDKLAQYSFRKDSNMIKNPFRIENISHSSINILYNSHVKDNKEYDFKRFEKEKESYILIKKYFIFNKNRIKI